MTLLKTPSSPKSPDRRTGGGILRRLLRDRRAVAAVEFAFIAPVLLSLYFVTMEVAQGIETNKKVGRIGSMVADLITQQPTVDKGQLEAIMKIGGSILAPYSRSKPEITVTGIEIITEEGKETPTVQVAWSRKLKDGTFSQPFTEGEAATVPEKLEIGDTFLVRVESKLEYRPVIAWGASEKANLGLAGAFDRIGMAETYYLRPRMSPDITCSDCAK